MTTIGTAASFVVFNPALDRRAQAVRKPPLSPQMPAVCQVQRHSRWAAERQPGTTAMCAVHVRDDCDRRMPLEDHRCVTRHLRNYPDIHSLPAVTTRFDVVRYPLRDLQLAGFIALGGLGKTGEQIVAAIVACDQAESLGRVNPLDRTG